MIMVLSRPLASVLQQSMLRIYVETREYSFFKVAVEEDSDERNEAAGTDKREEGQNVSEFELRGVSVIEKLATEVDPDRTDPKQSQDQEGGAVLADI